MTKTLIEEAIETIEGLEAQQAMPDPHYEPTLAKLKAAAEAEVLKIPDVTVTVVKQGANIPNSYEVNYISDQVVDLQIDWKERCEIAADYSVDADQFKFSVFSTKALVGIGDFTEEDQIPDPDTHTIIKVEGLGKGWVCMYAACGRYCLRLKYYKAAPRPPKRRIVDLQTGEVREMDHYVPKDEP